MHPGGNTKSTDSPFSNLPPERHRNEFLQFQGTTSPVVKLSNVDLQRSMETARYIATSQLSIKNQTGPYQRTPRSVLELLDTQV